jgi:hypothetical protein
MYLRVNFDDRKMSADRREWGVGAFWEWSALQTVFELCIFTAAHHVCCFTLSSLEGHYGV